jgi:hypothetical protein
MNAHLNTHEHEFHVRSSVVINPLEEAEQTTSELRTLYLNILKESNACASLISD